MVDSTGKVIGQFIPNYLTYPSVLASVSGYVVAITLAPYAVGDAYKDVTKLAPYGTTYVLYEGTACTGAAYFQPQNYPYGLRPAGVAADSRGAGTIYLGGTEPPTSHQFLSYMDDVGHCNNTTQSTWAVPLVGSVSVTSLFTAPYTIR
jgi:hypothetical protein